MNVEGYVSSGGLGGPAILPLSLAKMSQMTRASPIKHSRESAAWPLRSRALLFPPRLRNGDRCAPRRCLDQAIGPNVIKALLSGMTEFMERRGFKTLEDFRGIRRDRIVPHSQIKRPEQFDYRGGYDSTEEVEGYAAAHKS